MITNKYEAVMIFSVANGEDTLKGKIPFLPDTNDENAVGKLIETYAYCDD